MLRSTAENPALFGLLRLARFALAGTAASLACTVVAAGASLLVPAVSARAVDQVLTVRAHAPTLTALTGLLLLRVLAEACGGLARTSATTRVVASLRYRLLRQVFALGIPGLRRHFPGDLVSRLVGNAATGANAVPALVQIVVATGTSLIGLVALSLIDWRLGAVFLAGAIPAALLFWFLMNRSYSSYDGYVGLLGTIAARLTDALAGSRTIRASGTTRREVERVLVPLPELARCGMDNWVIMRAASWQVDLALTGIRVLVLVVAGLGVADGRISPGDFLASFLYLTFALGFLDQVHDLIYLSEARANTDRVAQVLAEQPSDCVGGSAGLPPGPGALSFRRVSVRLRDQLILHELDLDLPAGAVVAVVGRSGAGKTTLALLAARLIDPDEGVVLIDGVRVGLIDPSSLRREVGYAFDRPVLLGGTVREALSYGRPDLTGAEVEQAARVAGAEAFIRCLPNGFDTPLADAAFSGGELQRLGLARAVAHGGRILVLDDATSSLDTVTEAKVTDALTEHLAGRTRLVIAHRATTAAKADLVAWLDGGRIRALAPHGTLWSGEADYRAIFATEPESSDTGMSKECG